MVVVGSVNLDLVARSPRFPRPGETILGTRFAEHPGGKGLNQAVAAARSGARVALVDAVGDDRAGNELRELVRSEGINDTLLHTIPGASTGRALITIDETGENTIVVIPGANDALTVTDLPPAPVVLVQLEIPPNVALAALTLGREQRATTILNPAPATHARAALEPGADLVVPNEHELAQLGGVDVIRTLGARSVVVTRGAVGVDIVDGDLLTHIPPIRVTARLFPLVPPCVRLCCYLSVTSATDSAAALQAASSCPRWIGTRRSSSSNTATNSRRAPNASR